MATVLLRTTGEMESISPANGSRWTLVELQTLVGGYIEIARTLEGKPMVIDEEGKLKNKPLNIAATKLYIHGRRDPIVGDAVVIDTKQEMNGPDDDDEE